MTQQSFPKNTGLILKSIAIANMFAIAAVWYFKPMMGIDDMTAGAITAFFVVGTLVDIAIIQRVQSAKDRK